MLNDIPRDKHFFRPQLTEEIDGFSLCAFLIEPFFALHEKRRGRKGLREPTTIARFIVLHSTSFASKDLVRAMRVAIE
jgi:hypothetical protein